MQAQSLEAHLPNSQPMQDLNSQPTQHLPEELQGNPIFAETVSQATGNPLKFLQRKQTIFLAGVFMGAGIPRSMAKFVPKILAGVPVGLGFGTGLQCAPARLLARG